MLTPKIHPLRRKRSSEEMLPNSMDCKRERNFRSLWINRISASANLHGMSYSQLMGSLKSANIDLNRKVLADLAMNHPDAFEAIVTKVKK